MEIISPPLVDLVGWEPLSGPRAVGAGGSQTIGNFAQTTGSPFGLRRMKFLFPPLEGREARDFRGWTTALHGGANCTRWSFFDPDRMTFAEAGVVGVTGEHIPVYPWENGQPWSNGMGWELTRPNVKVSATTAKDGTIIKLGSEFWGHTLSRGDYIGFFPFHFGMYEITKVIAPGQYRIWPQLRKEITPDDFATLSPVLAMRMESEEGATLSRGGVFWEGTAITLIEILDYDVRKYVED